MIAAVRGPAGLRLIEQPPPLPDPGWEVLEVEACGICGTDRKILADPPGHPYTPSVILGHEIVARRESGERVVIEPNLCCGTCPACLAGTWYACPDFTTIGIFRDGGLARFVAAPTAALHPVPDDPAYRAAVLTEPLACVVHALERLASYPWSRPAVLGGGMAGQLFARLTMATNANHPVPVVTPLEDPLPSRRAVAEIGFHPGSLVPSERYDLVIDAYGGGLSRAVDLVAPGGTVLAFGMDSEVRPDPGTAFAITRKELTVVGAYVGRGAFPRAIGYLPLVAALYDRIVNPIPLEELPAALADEEIIKIVVDPRAV